MLITQYRFLHPSNKSYNFLNVPGIFIKSNHMLSQKEILKPSGDFIIYVP